MTDFPLEFASAEERTKFIKDNADYYTITWRKDRQNKRFDYESLETARFQAQIAANVLKRLVLIYGVICPFSDVNEPYGYSSWIETTIPEVNNANRIHRHSKRDDRLSKE